MDNLSVDVIFFKNKITLIFFTMIFLIKIE